MKILGGWRAAIAVALGTALCGAAFADGERTAFRVCRDPNNLPFANDKSEGFEDRIAQVLADDAKLKIEFFDFASRFNFIRNTLKFKLPGEDYHCDIVMGVPAGFDQVSATKPYYRSTYALVVPQGRKLDEVTSVEAFLALPAPTLKRMRIGVIDQSPASNWLVNHGLLDQGVPYRALIANLDQTAGQIIEDDLVAGKIDVAIVWGPIAGFYAKKHADAKLRVIPMQSEKGVKFDFAIAMGLRYGEKDWKAQVEQLIDRNQARINAILADYGVPVLDLAAAPPPAKN